MLKDYPVASLEYYHVIPIDDFKGEKLFVHAVSMECECHPIADKDNKLIITHNAYDTRDSRERFGAVEKPWINIRELRPLTLCELI